MDKVTCGKNGARIGPAISSSRSNVTFTTTVAPLQIITITNAPLFGNNYFYYQAPYGVEMQSAVNCIFTTVT